ncbi:Neurochondrin-domain-containing protein [Emericellopsis atlantica]|uniref:Neurochondrin-domain-containing protein n=1 Tax=Emericellopsis atlantica TaxID=2614577 RepID=A0A9P7ZLK0_9HYPO|nr:Neurochondrin-domain-containing protein [Emericellopsis atlantica]KAG9253937.1 Neurochondrin-domain-containing protein [Emericellopsis atlantica]
MEPSSAQDETAKPKDPAASLDRIRQFLRSRDDTQRFVGLALARSILDNHPELREDQHVVQSLWECIEPKFLDRLLKTGSDPANQEAKDMLDLSISILHTFSVLLPDESRRSVRFVARIPRVIAALLQSSQETTTLALQLLSTLASNPESAARVRNVEDLSPLTEIAPSNPLALNVLRLSWLNTMAGENATLTSSKVAETLKILIPSFSGTDAVTLLEFLGDFLRQADSKVLLIKTQRCRTDANECQLIPATAPWLPTVVTYIQNLVKSRPTPEARAAYTNASASILQAYPDEASKLLFAEDRKDEKPSGYLFVNLILIDIRSSIPMLLEHLNSPEYPKTSRRLALDFDVVSIFIGFLLRSLDEDGPMVMSPDSLLKLRKGISETMSVTAEYLRDRWDASVAGAMGLHVDARTGAAETSTGSRPTLTWDSKTNNVDEDPLTLSSLRALSIWLREDENDTLRKEATGLMDMFMELYRGSDKQSEDKLDFRSPVLVALEALVTFDKGRDIFLSHEGWKLLSSDLVRIVGEPLRAGSAYEARRGIDIVRVLLAVAESQRTGTEEEWMALVNNVHAMSSREEQAASNPFFREFQVAVLQLCTTLFSNANMGMVKRYYSSLSSLLGIAGLVQKTIGEDDALREPIDDVLSTLEAVR